jgi:hypothetical protein
LGACQEDVIPAERCHHLRDREIDETMFDVCYCILYGLHKSTGVSIPSFLSQYTIYTAGLFEGTNTDDAGSIHQLLAVEVVA